MELTPKTERRAMIGYLIATAVLVIARTWLGMLLFKDDFLPALGTATGGLTWGLMAAAIYWFTKARRKEDGKFRTARVMFFWSVLGPIITHVLPRAS